MAGREVVAMTVHGAWGAGRVVELDEDECWELLGTRPVGRVGFDDGAGPAVLPVNHSAVERRIRFRVSPHGSFARALDGQVVAFEVDEIDEFRRAGWSVLVRGRARLDPTSAAWAEPTPWPEGIRSLVVEVEPVSVSGRRILGT
jgi:uncharacterized protein